MFNSARIQLTFYYLLIIMLISFLFSVVIHELITAEFDRITKMNRISMETEPYAMQFQLQDPSRRIVYINPKVIEESKYRLKMMLVGINLGILTFSAFAGFYLAGRTLRPIQNMVEQQHQFITDASHELKTPLTALKTEIEVSLRDNNLSLKEAKNLLQSNLEEVNSLQHLSQSLLLLSQTTERQDGLKVEKIAIKAEVERAIKKVFPLTREKKVSIENSIGNQVVLAQKNTVVESMVILLDNAIKYSQDGGKVQLKSGKTDGLIYISVTDYGIGIPKREQPMVFDRFYRTDKSRSKKDTHGFGLGLSIAKKIITSSNGKIEVKSDQTKGTTFTLFLPKAQ